MDPNDELAKSVYAKSDVQLHGSEQGSLSQNARADARIKYLVYWISV
jgi:hypothetical protein